VRRARPCRIRRNRSGNPSPLRPPAALTPFQRLALIAERQSPRPALSALANAPGRDGRWPAP
jgi:hypothetical protein